MPKSHVQAFFAYSFKNKEAHRSDYEKIKELLNNYQISCYSFVFDYTKKPENWQQLMSEALKQIDKSDYYFADPSIGSFGIGLEAGYAKGKNKKVFYLYKVGSEYEETLEGISNYVIHYKNVDDILDWLTNNITKIVIPGTDPESIKQVPTIIDF